MLVSIIIPSFRQPHFLGRAIESCLEQDYEALEVIVVEDRSRDSSLALALSYAHADARVRVVECEENGGLGKARNVGLAHATGDYLCFLDSDDYLLDRSISARIDALDNAIATHGDAVVGVYGDWQHVTESVDYPEVRAARTKMPLVSSQTYTGENVFICSAPLVQRDAVLAAGGFPEGLRMLEDFSLWAKVIAAGGIFVPVHHVVATYRQRPNSMLRGDGVVVMADHVRVINDWAKANGLPLADGGALTAWLANEEPASYGRMSWNAPSVLGNYGSEPDANAVQSGAATPDAPTQPIDDFMTHSASTGLDHPWPLWTPANPGEISLALVASTFEESLLAIGIAQGHDPASIAIFASEPTDWEALWPLALAGHAVRATSELSGVDSDVQVDLSSASHRFSAERAELIESGVAAVWPEQSEARSGSLVYVPMALDGYAALDAWVSTALHALADAGLEPRIVCDPEMRPNLAGYRAEFVSVSAMQSAEAVVMPTGDGLSWVGGITPAVVFDPSVDGGHARTAGELREQIAGLASSRR